MAKKEYAVFTLRTVRGRSKFASDPMIQVTAGVWLDLDLVDRLILKAAGNKNRKARAGAMNVEVHKIEHLEVPRG